MVLSQLKTKPAEPVIRRSSAVIFVPVLLIKSMKNDVCGGDVCVKLKLKVLVVSTSDPPPPPSFMTGSVPSASAAEQLTPINATKTNKREIFTTDPRSNLKKLPQSTDKVQLHRHLLSPPQVSSLCNQWL